MNLNISVEGLDAIRDHAKSLPDEEVCGAILRGVHVKIRNVAKPHLRHRRFRMDPEQQMKLWALWGREGELVIYHSHPRSEAKPSDEDMWVMSRNPDIFFIIYSNTTDEFRAFRYDESLLAVVEIQIDTTGSTQHDRTGSVTTDTKS